jgi:hypothetical protein
MPQHSADISNPLLISEVGKRGEGYAALIVSGDMESATHILEEAPAQIWDSEDGYTKVMPVHKYLRFGQWQLLPKPIPWEEPE